MTAYSLCMDVTPKKIVDENTICFLCGFKSPRKERVNVFGKSSEDIGGLINGALSINISDLYPSSGGLFICTKSCYKRLIRYKKTKLSLQAVQDEIVQEFRKNEVSLRKKRLRRETEDEFKQELEQDNIGVPGRSDNTSSVAKSVQQLFPTICTSLYAASSVPYSYSGIHGPIFTSTPRKNFQTSTPKNFQTSEKKSGRSVTSKVLIEYPSKTVRKCVHPDYESITKALAYGTPESLAKAVTKCKVLTKHVVASVLQLLSKEVSGLCSTSNPTLLRKCAKTDLENFNLQLVCEEWKKKAPIFYSFLITSASTRTTLNCTWLSGVAMAGSVLLKQRNNKMNAAASVLGVMIKSGSLESALDRLSKLKVSCCNKVVLSKLDVLGDNFDMILKTAKEDISSESVKTKALSCGVTNPSLASTPIETDKAKEILQVHQKSCHPGFTIAFDNIDLEIHRKNMTASKQNRDIHWVNHNMFTNRVSGNLLPTEAPKEVLSTVSNMKFLPSAIDQLRQRYNYTVLVSRILVDYFDVYAPLKDACIYHIPHKFSKEMSEKSVKVQLGTIFKNENVNEDMVAILQQLQSYLPKTTEGAFDNQIIAGDQLSIERAVNLISSVSNGYTPEDRLEGFNLQIGDWHAGVKILSLIYKRFFSAKSEVDKCTLSSDRALINRRNVTAEPHSAYCPDRDFLAIVIKARVITAAFSVLGFIDKQSCPTKYPLPDDISTQSKQSKLEYLHKAASLIVDKFVFSDDYVNHLLDSILTNQEIQDVQDQQPRTADGRFLCRFPGCQVSFKYDGASRRRHEATHDPPPEVPAGSVAEKQSSYSKPSKSTSIKCKSNTDDVYSYNCALLADGLLFQNFLDSIKEGDGSRLMRQYKYVLLYCKADGQGSTKYALECLYQAFLVEALLSSRDSERFVCNRSVNTNGGIGNNIPHDLEVEHSNRFIKTSIKNLGPNVTEKAVRRICQSENAVRSMLNNFDQGLHRIKRSGKHTKSCEEGDLNELIKRAVSADIFTSQPGRKYSCFSDFERDPFKNLEMSALYQWINKHKENIQRGNRAR